MNSQKPKTLVVAGGGGHGCRSTKGYKISVIK